MHLAQKKGVHMLSLSKNGATAAAWKAAKLARDQKQICVGLKIQSNSGSATDQSEKRFRRVHAGRGERMELDS